ncbi:MAG: hypothetical protein ACLQSR_17120 [Limisphaerales bacterium]
MTETASTTFPADMLRDLRAFETFGREILALAIREHQALDSAEAYEPFEFYQSRKVLLDRLNRLIIKVKQWRGYWQKISPVERLRYPDIKLAMQMVQDLIVKILQLDRENQQALLRRGLVPVRHVSSCAVPPNNYVANLYRRHNP